MIKQSNEMQEKMQQALHIIESNINSNVKHAYDFEVFRSIAKLIWHTTQTYKDLSELEKQIAHANKVHFENHALAYQDLEKALALGKGSIERRKTVFQEVVATWEKTRLPKGISTKEKKYFFQHL